MYDKNVDTGLGLKKNIALKKILAKKEAHLLQCVALQKLLWH